MRLSILVDNNTLIDRYFSAEPGVAFHIDTGESRVLFDCGYSDALLRNAAGMRIDLCQLDAVVLSHGHIDHTGGLEPLARFLAQQQAEHGVRVRPQLISHPAAIAARKLDDGSSNGIAISAALLDGAFELHASAEALWIDRRLVFLGQIERRTSFERAPAIGLRSDGCGGWLPDELPDDSALVYLADDGIVVISGCSHSGICNIVQAARRVTGVDRVIDIIGGFHLQNPPKAQLEGTVAFIEALDLSALHACHCTDLQSKVALAAAAPLREVGCGLQLEY